MNLNLGVVLVKRFNQEQKKKEIKTPKGSFKIGNLYFRKDRIKKPTTLLKCIEIKKNMGWCDDVHFQKNITNLLELKKKSNMKN